MEKPTYYTTTVPGTSPYQYGAQYQYGQQQGVPVIVTQPMAIPMIFSVFPLSMSWLTL